MGNTHAKRSGGDDGVSDDGSFGPGSPPPSPGPGSPLTYSPQMAMDPMPMADNAPLVRDHAAEFHGLAAWPAQPKLVPTVIVWSHGGEHVEVEGSFDNWGVRHTMQKSGKDFTIIKLLPPGVYQYKFIVDGEWKYAPDQPAMHDERGIINNVVEVQEYVPDHLDSLVGFEPPPSPPESYDNPRQVPEDFAKDPPAMPPHLQLTLLNVPSVDGEAQSLPRPQHVILNHLYCQRNSRSINATVVGTTHRYKSKYVTTVMYKPKRRRSAAQRGLDHGGDHAMSGA
ncbi:5'-AMP-activated protein kinase subunit beta-2 [Coccomyxa sp. Obi]|nr:5'-AMP-activated protein kinase subunit beta-2 [Coccomyxa sp. Obi]